MSLAEKLVSLRKQKGLTQMDLAERLNVSRQAISRWEAGAAVPSTDNLKVLGELYGVSVDYLLNDKADASFENTEIQEVTYNQEETRKRNRRIFVCILVLVTVISFGIYIIVSSVPKDKEAYPMNNMDIAEDDNSYSTETFLID